MKVSQIDSNRMDERERERERKREREREREGKEELKWERRVSVRNF